jgi:transposase
MKLHRNAKSTPTSRLAMVRRVLVDRWPYAAVAEGFAVSVRTVAKWVRRFRAGGIAALEDGRSRPSVSPRQTRPELVDLMRALREAHGLPAWVISRALRVPRSTVSAWLRRLGLARPPVTPPLPVQRYEWAAPGDLLHLDIKPLGRFQQIGHRIHGNPRLASPGAGWEYVHVAVDDHSRLAFVEVLGAQDGEACAGFLRRAVAWYATHGIRCRRLLSDNGSG